jgi:hypothetical protein
MVGVPIFPGNEAVSARRLKPFSLLNSPIFAFAPPVVEDTPCWGWVDVTEVEAASSGEMGGRATGDEEGVNNEILFNIPNDESTTPLIILFAEPVSASTINDAFTGLDGPPPIAEVAAVGVGCCRAMEGGGGGVGALGVFGP